MKGFEPLISRLSGGCSYRTELHPIESGWRVYCSALHRKKDQDLPATSLPH